MENNFFSKKDVGRIPDLVLKEELSKAIQNIQKSKTCKNCKYYCSFADLYEDELDDNETGRCQKENNGDKNDFITFDDSCEYFEIKIYEK